MNQRSIGRQEHSKYLGGLRRQNNVAISLMALCLTAASFGFLVPASSGINSSSQMSARVFSDGIKVRLDRNSPAFAALEDVWSDPLPHPGSKNKNGELADSINKEASPEGEHGIRPIALTADGPGVEHLAAKILRANLREKKLLAQELRLRESKAIAVSAAASKALGEMFTHFRPLPAAQDSIEPTSLRSKGTIRTVSLKDLNISRDELIGSLMLPIANSGSNANEDAAPNPDNHGIKFNDYHRRTLNAFTTIGRSQQNSPRVIRAPRIPQRIEGREENSAEVVAPPEPAMGSMFVQRHTKKTFDDNSDENNSEQARLHQVLVSGTIEFTDGLAVANAQDRVVVYRELDGDPLEHAAVWLRKGSFELFAEENIGFIVAELRTPYGDVVGRNVVDLSKATISNVKQRRIERVALKIKPVLQGISGQVSISKSELQAIPVRQAEVLLRDLPFNTKTNQTGHFEESRFLEGSTAVLRVNRPGYLGTVAMAHAGSENKLEIFKYQHEGQLRKLLSSIQSNNFDAGRSAFVWGRVTKSGSPMAGAQVEILTTKEALRPIYFNANLVPDLNLKATSNNGLYLFVPVNNGSHAVHAVHGNGIATEPILFPCEGGAASHVDIETNQTSVSKVKVFDAFSTDHPLPAKISRPGSNSFTTVDRAGVGTLKYAPGQGLLILDSEIGSGYAQTRIAMSSGRRIAYFPMIQESWLEGMRGVSRVNFESGTGVVVGFIQGASPYRVALEESSTLSSSKIIYFNNRGEPSENDFGEPGGGFVVFNVPEGFRTITIQPSGSMKIHSAVTLVEGRVTSVVSHWIR